MAQNVNAARIEELLNKWKPQLKTKIEPIGKGFQVIATAKNLTLTKMDLIELSKITGDTTVELGRSGANFRMKFY